VIRGYDFEKLDNLLWLTGKLLRGSFSILMNKEKYEKLTADLNFPKKCKSKEVDNLIRDYIKKNFKNSSIFSNDVSYLWNLYFRCNKAYNSDIKKVDTL